MKRSIEFKMPRQEEQKFIEFLASNPDIVIVSPTSNTENLEIIKDFHKEGENIFWNKAYITRTEDVDKIRMSYVKSCSHYIIEDTYEAPVIEIRRGTDSAPNAKLYAEFHYFKNEKEVFKGEVFEKLYKKIETWIRINYDSIEQIFKMHSKC